MGGGEREREMEINNFTKRTKLKEKKDTHKIRVQSKEEQPTEEKAGVRF